MSLFSLLGRKDKVLRIRETGCFIAIPDKVCVMVDMKGKEYFPDYKKASEQADRDTKSFLSWLEELEIERMRVESKELSIVSVQEENEEKGYTYRHFIEITIPVYTEQLYNLVRFLRESEFCVTLDYEYRVSCEEFAREEALEDGVKKCIRKAQIIANELDIKLDGIRKISYDGICADEEIFNNGRYLIPKIRDNKKYRLIERQTDVSKYIANPVDRIFREEVVVEWFVKDCSRQQINEKRKREEENSPFYVHPDEEESFL